MRSVDILNEGLIKIPQELADDILDYIKDVYGSILEDFANYIDENDIEHDLFNRFRKGHLYRLLVPPRHNTEERFFTSKYTKEFQFKLSDIAKYGNYRIDNDELHTLNFSLNFGEKYKGEFGLSKVKENESHLNIYVKRVFTPNSALEIEFHPLYISDFTNIETMLSHELGHLVQYTIFKDSKEVKTKNYTNPDEDYEKYLINPIEIKTWLDTSVREFISYNRNLFGELYNADMLKHVMKVYMGIEQSEQYDTSDFFLALKKFKPVLYKKTVKEFSTAIFNHLEKSLG